MEEFMHGDPLSLCIIEGREEEESDPKLVKQLAYLEVNCTVV